MSHFLWSDSIRCNRAVRWVTCCWGGCDGKFPATGSHNSKSQHFSPSWKDVPRISFVLPLILCVFLLACFTLSTIVRKEVCHITCVFALAGMCVGLFMMVFTGFLKNSPNTYPVSSFELLRFSYNRHYFWVKLSKRIFFFCTQSLPTIRFLSSVIHKSCVLTWRNHCFTTCWTYI